MSSKDDVANLTGENLANKSEEDEELSQLLDNSLHDFGKCNISPITNECQSSPTRLNDDFDTESAKHAASDFQKMLKQLADIQEVIMKQMAPADISAGVSQNGEIIEAIMTNGHHSPDQDDVEIDLDNNEDGSGASDELEMAQNFLKNMQFLAEKAQKVQTAKTDTEFTDAMKELGDDEIYESEFMPFMHGLMGSLLSKEMLYTPMKEMCEKYPKWLEENKNKLDEKSFENYEKQLNLMKEACQEYDQEKSDDTDQDRAQRMDRLMTCMQKIQACGYPPEDLVGALPPGWCLDAQSGLPKAEDMEKAAEACSLM